jgi:membrane associated rhomboid family serine protease
MAFLQPPASQQPAVNIPWPVALLLVAFVAVHVLRTVLLPGLSDVILARYAFNPALYSQAFLSANNLDPGSLWDQSIPFLSYIFLHGDWTHLAINSLWMLAFGPVVARRFGALRFFLFFFVCGIAAAAVQMLCTWGQFAPIIGASGAISGLMAAGIRMLPLQGPLHERLGTPLLPLLSRQVLLFSSIWAITNVAAGLTGFAGVGSEIRLIAWQAHLGGYAAGLLLCDLFDRWRNQTAPVA